MAQRPWEVLKEQTVTLSDAKTFIDKSIKENGSRPDIQSFNVALERTIKDKRIASILNSNKKGVLRKFRCRGLAQVLPLHIGQIESGIDLFLQNFVFTYMPELAGLWICSRKPTLEDDKGFSSESERLGVIVFPFQVEVLVFSPRPGASLVGVVNEIGPKGLSCLVLDSVTVTIDLQRLMPGSIPKLDEEDESNNRILKAREMDILGLQQWLVDVCTSLKIYKPFPIQREVIPLILKKLDVIACAPTGQGKTASFVLPLLQRFLKEDRQPWFSLVIAPTRELVLQLCEQIHVFGAPVNIRVVTLTGGEDLCRQKNDLIERPCHVIVATPGRLGEIIESDQGFAKRFRRVKILCLDECDRLLDASMAHHLEAIISSLDFKNVQKLCFSATMDDESIKSLQNKLSMNPVSPFIRILGEPETLNHRKIVCSSVPVYCFLNYLISETKKHPLFSGRGIIFTSTIEECETLCKALKKLGHSIISLHSLLTQRERRAAYDLFKKEETRILIATDVAARGLDLPKVDWVINLDVPKEFDTYKHRVGRCARAGKPGTALTFVCLVLRHKDKSQDKNMKKFTVIENRLNAKIEAYWIDEEDALMFPNKINKAIATAKYSLEKESFSEKLEARRKRRRHE